MRFGTMFIMILLVSSPAALHGREGPSGQTEREITHLLDYIEQSECRFIRNGTVHPADKAAAHIRKKYAYIKPNVSSAEDFISFAATKSSITGRPYRVRCGERSMKSSDWLLNELATFRRSDPARLQTSPE